MAFQAQVAQWAEQAVRAVIGPLFERVEKLEAYVRALENADVVPAAPEKAQTAVSRPTVTDEDPVPEEEPKSRRTTHQVPQTRTGRPGGAVRGK